MPPVRAWRPPTFNPHRPRRSGAINAAQYADLFQQLSILTAPEGAVQFGLPLSAWLCPVVFQSSPPPKERCNILPAGVGAAAGILSILTAPEGAVQCAGKPSGTAPRRRDPFNPHRPRRSGAMQAQLADALDISLSILTAPEGAVQFILDAVRQAACRLSILTAPEGAVQWVGGAQA